MLPVQVIGILVVLEDEAVQGPVDQGFLAGPEQFGGRLVGFQDQATRGEAAIAHRGQIVEIEIPRLGNFQFLPGLQQFLVLKFQFDLMNLEFMNQT